MPEYLDYDRSCRLYDLISTLLSEIIKTTRDLQFIRDSVLFYPSDYNLNIAEQLVAQIMYEETE